MVSKALMKCPSSKWPSRCLNGSRRRSARPRMPDTVGVAVTRLPHSEGLDLPHYTTTGAAGMDVVSAEDVTLVPGARHAVATGLALAIPPGYEIQVRPRSGLALKHGITVPTTPGTIDSDYRSEEHTS